VDQALDGSRTETSSSTTYTAADVSLMAPHLAIDESMHPQEGKFIALWYRRRREAMRDGRGPISALEERR